MRTLLRQILANAGVTAVLIRIARFVSGVYHKLDEHHVFLMAGGLAFSLLFCIVPLVLVAFAVLGIVLETTSVITQIGNWIDRSVPSQQFAEYLKSLLFARAEEFRIYKGIAGLAGMIGLFLAASGLFASMRTILDAVYRIRDSAAIYKAKARDVGLVFLVLVYFLLSMAIIPLADVLLGLAGRLPFLAWLDLALVERVLINVISILLILGGYFSMYFVVPRQALPARVVFVSALSATVLWFLAKELFGLYIMHAANMQRIYGTYVMVVMLGLWIYYTSLVFILGAVIGQVYREMRTKVATGTLAQTTAAAD